MRTRDALVGDLQVFAGTRTSIYELIVVCAHNTLRFTFTPVATTDDQYSFQELTQTNSSTYTASGVSMASHIAHALNLTVVDNCQDTVGSRPIFKYKSSSEDEIANVNFLRRHRTCRSQSLCPLNRVHNFYCN